jgi:starvation-inducible DNA-binding protein
MKQTVTNDVPVSDIVRTNELQPWFISQHLVDPPVVPPSEGDR